MNAQGLDQELLKLTSLGGRLFLSLFLKSKLLHCPLGEECLSPPFKGTEKVGKEILLSG